MLQRPIRRCATLLLAGSLALLLIPGVAFAHAELKTATPADKATVPPPVTEVSGIYTEAMQPAGSSIIVKDTSGATVAQGTVDPDDATRMMAKPSTPLGIGSYAVDWTSVALDGHVERGAWSFTVGIAAPSVGTPSPTPNATPSLSAAVTAQPTPVPATPSPSAAPTPVPSAGASTTGSGGDVILPIVLALIILGAGAAYLLSRRNRPPSTT